MIRNLYIENFVLIDKINLDFEKGFSAFIGETGAGKSIFIDAISLLCGQRATSDFISKGKEEALIEGTFEFKKDSYAYQTLVEAGFEVEEETIITRKLYASGKSTARINHRNVTVSLLKDVLAYEVDIHGQRDTGYLLNANTHISLLDSYLKLDQELERVNIAYDAYIEVLKKKEHALNDVFNESDLEFFEYQLNEIEAAHLKIGEDEELALKEKQFKAMKSSLENFNRLLSLYDDEFSSSFYELNRLVQNLEEDESIDAYKTTINDSYYAVEDAIASLRDSFDLADLSEDEINAMEERLFVIQSLKRKYGSSIEAIFEKRDALIERIDQFKHRESYLKKLEQQEQVTYKAFLKEAKALSTKRIKGAKKLNQEIDQQLHDLKLENAHFETSISETKANKRGIDRVEFMVSMNHGEDVKPLVKTASGGELSRLMLGLKVIFTRLLGIETVIFDEIDAGVSGSVATSIGQKMQTLGHDTQVFSVTHLAPVASCANQIYLVEKSLNNNKTTSKVSKMNEEKAIEQLALIASGSITPSSIEAARELYKRNHA